MATSLGETLIERTVSLDRVAKAFSSGSSPSDQHLYGSIWSVNSDGSYEVVLNGGTETVKCAPLCLAEAGDRVMCVLQTNGRVAAIARLKGDYGISYSKVLWSGNSYMTESHTRTFSEPVSAQPHGIVLVWGGYSNGAVSNANFNFTFVPKLFTSLQKGKGLTCIMSKAATSAFGTKYLYLSDTQITGYSTNATDQSSASASGIKNTNSYWVLRYVIGV